MTTTVLDPSPHSSRVFTARFRQSPPFVKRTAERPSAEKDLRIRLLRPRVAQAPRPTVVRLPGLGGARAPVEDLGERRLGNPHPGAHREHLRPKQRCVGAQARAHRTAGRFRASQRRRAGRAKFRLRLWPVRTLRAAGGSAVSRTCYSKVPQNGSPAVGESADGTT